MNEPVNSFHLVSSLTRCPSVSVVAYESYQFTRADGQFGNIEYSILAVLLYEFLYLDFHLSILNACNVQSSYIYFVHTCWQSS